MLVTYMLWCDHRIGQKVETKMLVTQDIRVGLHVCLEDEQRPDSGDDFSGEEV
jgi:hypothetical protein